MTVLMMMRARALMMATVAEEEAVDVAVDGDRDVEMTDGEAGPVVGPVADLAADAVVKDAEIDAERDVVKDVETDVEIDAKRCRRDGNSGRRTKVKKVAMTDATNGARRCNK